jgi:phage terminase small subunit
MNAVVAELPKEQARNGHPAFLIKAKYRGKMEAPAYLEFDSEDEFKKRVDELKKNEQVESISLFQRRWIHTRVLTWEVSE